ncbi:MAG: succinylglutamate desuccinylase/aspartoacylase family protein [Alphaproteobacteria bacterium]
MTADPTKPFTINGVAIKSGSRQRIEIPVAKLYNHTDVTMPVEVIRGTKDGPVLFVTAAIHGDEINGVEIIRRLLTHRKLNPKKLAGTLIAVPIVNVFGFNRNTRYMPDRRDLNRCFPGSPSGSLAAQMAHILMTEIVGKATHGIDLHTGAIHRTNLPQIRACLDDPETDRLAHSFKVPVIINSSVRDGSLRQTAADLGIPMLLFEGGEALRYDEKVIRTGLHGVMEVMMSIGMLARTAQHNETRGNEMFVARSSKWVRAPHSGSLRTKRKVGDRVKAGDRLGIIADPYGDNEVEVRATVTGIIIGQTLLPLVNNGDALFHIARFEDSEAVEEELENFEQMLGPA